MTAIDADTRAVPPARREWSWAAWLFAFACFFPYPALAIGGNTGLQVSQAAALAAIPFLVARPPGRSLWAMLLLLGPVFVSMFLHHMFADVPLPDVLVKQSIGLALAVLVIWPADWLADRDLFREVLAAAGAAIVLHSLIGLYQLYSFSKDQFPLLFLYVNPSFLSMEEWGHDVHDYARYVKRPCGLFPEPSAMAASLGPWIVLLAGLLLDPGLRRRLGWRRAWPVLPPVACGCLMLALSESGSTFALIAALLVICAGEVWRMVHAPQPSQLVMVALVLLSVASVLGYAISQLGSDLTGRIDSSWGLRAASIRMGLTLTSDPLNLAVGVGPGQSSPIIMSHWSGPPIPKIQGDVAIWSVAACYYAETGLLGAAALLAVLGMAVGAIVRSSAVLLGLCALGSWLVGVVVTTSYCALSPVWLFLGVVLSWDRLFPRAASMRGR